MRAMVPGTRSLHGRARELSALTSALEDACDGRGALWLVSGEPGIGKSRLCEEAARVAAERDVSVLWGRCWEAGGAPAYWPWIQLARTLLRARGVEGTARLTHGRMAELAQLLPELAAAQTAIPSLEPEQARFRVPAALSSLLCEAAAETPFLIVLEDLHAADASSLLLLDFLSRQLSCARLLVLAT
jgi:predicted ATPase